jgi:hypothetical protein
MAAPLHFDTVWVSTDAQFAAFDKAVRDASWLTKIIGRYRIPPGAAYLSAKFPPWRMPIVLVANGTLSFTGNTITFTSAPMRKAMGARYHNMLDDLAFELSGADICTVETYDATSPFLSHFNMTWTRLRTAKPPPLDDFLLAVGTFTLETGKARQRSADLRAALQALRQDG